MEEYCLDEVDMQGHMLEGLYRESLYRCFISVSMGVLNVYSWFKSALWFSGRFSCAKGQ